MRIISFAKLKTYFTKHADAKVGLQEWHQKAKKAEWNDISDVKKTFNSVDAVGNDRYVFNIKGNNYRLIAIVRFNLKRLFVRWIGTHAEYDKLKDVDKL
ncbi:MAG: type II toxin-antitoxin system HigB family toxin [Marinilabiliaceae bacterium]|nr:type II toxin-antitoxin system HigB family toxin [Marinilabiliaceae bacterium]